MLRRPLAVHLFVILAAVLVLPFDHFVQAAAAPPHVLMVLMENTSYEQIVGNSQMPFVNAQVAANGSVSTTDLSHPSLPNYLGLTSGSIWNNPPDTTPQDMTYAGPQFTDELASAGIAWKAYMQDMPVACDLTDQFGPGGYDVNHDPFMYYDTVRTNPSQCNRVVPYPQLTTDLNSGTAPPFLWVSPNLTNDMHDGTPAQGDAFLQGLVTQVKASTWWTAGSRIVITWDEGASTEQVLTLVIGSAHGTAANGGTEYGTLRGLEEAYGVGLLGHAADSNVGDIFPLLSGAAPPPPAPTPTPSSAPTLSSSPSPSPAPPPSLPSGPSSGTRGVFRYTSTDFAAMHTAGFNAATDGGVQDNGAAEAANGIAGMVWVDAYNNTTCAQTITNAGIAAMVQANVNAGYAGLRYQIGDEPTANGCNAPPIYAAITQTVHSVDPTAKTWADDDQFQVGSPLQQGVPMKGTVDILAFDVYPCQSGPCDYSAIDSAVKQIHAANVTNWEFIIQDFSASPWRWPTPAEIQAQFDHWKNQGASGYWVFAWDYLGQQVIQQSGNIAMLQSINSQAINGSPSTSPSPLPSPSPSPSSQPVINPGVYTAMPSKRLLDTRSVGGKLGPGGSMNLAIGGTNGVPVNASAVILNVTAVDESAAGFFSVYPTGAALPTASNLNWVAGATVPNLVSVGLGTGGSVTIYNGLGTANAVVDLEGYFAPSGGGSSGQFVPVVPARITDTRAGSGNTNHGLTLTAGATLPVQVTGVGGIPASGVTAVVLNATVTDTTKAGFLTVFPTGASLPLASNLNWTAGVTVPNRVIVPVGTGGQVSFYNGLGSADLIVDVNGYFTDSSGTGASFVPLTPTRIVDTRTGGATLGPGATMTVTVAGNGGVGATGAKAVVLNVTVVNPTTASALTVWSGGGTRPVSSDLNFVLRQTVPNLVVVMLSATGQIDIFNASGSTNVIVDIVGWYG